MPTAWKTVRVFISSTFRDMHAERDHLVRFVFPELRERCAARQIHLVDVDLRWGVTEEDAERGKALEICLQEIEDCRPFFIGILGERYGWTPPRYEVPDDDRFDWVRQTEQGHSITALEIYHGVLNNTQMRRRAFFYFRDPSFINHLADDQQADFRAESAEDADKVRGLKDRIRRAGIPVLENYRWDDLDAFGQRVLDDLWTAIDAEHPADVPQLDPLDAERSYHDFFIETRGELFIGQRHLLARLHDHAAGNKQGPLVVTGTPGSGKSALLVRFIQQFRRLNPDEYILYHFIGTSPTSTDLRRMLLRLCQELAKQFGITDEIPQELEQLRATFRTFVEQAAAERRVVLVVDALNQLDDADRSHELGWLPYQCSANLRLVISTLEGDTLDAARQRHPDRQEMHVTSLRLADQGFILARQLAASRKRLTTARKWRQAWRQSYPDRRLAGDRAQRQWHWPMRGPESAANSVSFSPGSTTAHGPPRPHRSSSAKRPIRSI